MDLSQKDVNLVEKNFNTTPKMKSLCNSVVTEGCILLKNDGVLPVKNKKISVFGRCQLNTFLVGYGSGGAVKAPYKISLLDGLINKKANLNMNLVNKYQQWVKNNIPDEGTWGNWPLYFPEMPLSTEDVIEAKNQSEVAIVVIGRSAGEDRDILKEAGSWYLTLEEKNLLKMVREHFDKMCVLINSGSIMDTKEILSFNPNALMYIYQGGQEMGNGVASLLIGEVSPSGKLTDTIADIMDYPSTPHFGYPDSNTYFEDIYVGYRYFNTFAKDKIVYPFGYGLTYSKFDYKVNNVSHNDDKIRLNISVKNIGEFKAKEVVQTYLSKPQYKLGNPKYELVSFYKTKELDINEEETFDITLDVNDFTSYDDIGVTGYINSFVLEEGEYKLYIGFDSINLENVYSFVLDKTRLVKETLESCAPTLPFERMVNRGGISYELVKVKNIDVRERILSNLPLNNQINDSFCHFSDVVSGKITLDTFVESLDFEELEALTRGSLYSMNSPLGPLGNTATFAASNQKLFDRGIPALSTNDGPSGVRMACHSTLVPNGSMLASTFNSKLIEELAFEIGKEVIERESHVMLAPGLNIHRSPLCGRNFEYFSEDPYLTGMLASSYVKGIQKTGASACPKHFACNNQEYLRYANDSILSQRALRQIYVKAFEICIKEAQPDVIMTSYNKVNGEFSYYNYELVKNILRDDLNFKGLVITDWWIREADSPLFRDLKTQAYRIRSTVDVYMPGSRGDRENPGVSDGTLEYSLNKKALTLAEIRYCAKNVLALCVKHVK